MSKCQQKNSKKIYHLPLQIHIALYCVGKMPTKIEAHVFTTISPTTHEPHGGNPVTIFLLNKNEEMSCENRSALAKSCAWESVLVHLPLSVEDDSKEVLPRFFFYMPSGEEVSFCAHAAIGACVAVKVMNAMNNTQVDTVADATNFFVKKSRNGGMCLKFCVGDGIQSDVRIASVFAHLLEEGTGGTLAAELDMDYSKFKEKCTAKGEENLVVKYVANVDSLLNEIGLKREDVEDGTGALPSYINSSVARPKTIVAVKSLDLLHSAVNPKRPEYFRKLCDEIDSSGLYLYCNHDIIESRQFPRASGYPEDPATGIAATALACSLQLRNRLNSESSINVFQGTAMGRRSRISIRFERSSSTFAKTVFCSGNVSISSIAEL